MLRCSPSVRTHYSESMGIVDQDSEIVFFLQGNNLVERIYDDIRAYISDESTGFLSGSTVNVEMLVPDITSLRWIELEPYSEASTNVVVSDDTVEEGTVPSALWTLESLSVDLNNGEQEGKFPVDRQFMEGTPARIFVAKILVAADVKVLDNDDKADNDEEAQVIESSNNDLLIASGESIEISPRIIGSPDGFTAALVKVDTTTGATGRVNLDDTRGYTKESIAERAKAATDSREKEIWEGAKVESGLFEFDKEKIKFTPPRNYTDKSLQYEIRIISNENTAAVLPIRVTVENESDPVAKKLDELAKIIEAETLRNAVQQASSSGSSGVFESSGGGSSSSGSGAGE